MAESSDTGSTAPEQVIIDTDPGIDDCMALFLALSCPHRIQVKGVTIIFGNHYDLDLLAGNACRVLDMAAAENINVYKGCAVPLDGVYGGHSGVRVHGENAIGGFAGREVVNRHLVQETSAADFIIETCKQNPKQITIITLGPLTNIATAFQKCPELPQYVKRIVSMGGVLNEPGNITPVAEANFGNDALAAKTVLNAKFPLTLVPLNVTRQVHLNSSFRQTLKGIGEIGDFIYNTTEHYVALLTKWGNDPEKIAIHDSSAVMAVLRPEFFTKKQQIYIDVESKGERTKGMCVPDWKGHFRKEEGYHLNTEVLLGVDDEAFKQFYIECITALVNKVES
ncbi:mediator complex subunit Med15 [Balamuthia mandrillaris]